MADAGRAGTIGAPEAPDRLLQAERDKLLRRAIESLPPRQKSTLILRVFEELPYKEIARVMGCTVGTAKANFFHAVGFLRRAMQESR
jgi:RNA polymerase sigma factor (sigma-70 family)